MSEYSEFDGACDTCIEAGCVCPECDRRSGEDQRTVIAPLEKGSGGRQIFLNPTEIGHHWQVERRIRKDRR